MKTIFSDSDRAYMYSHYQTQSYKEIAEHLGFTERQIRGHLNNVGLTKMRSSLKADYFDNIDSSEKAYFLGLMFTDGYVVWNPARRSYEASLGLQIEDAETVHAYAAALGVPHKVQTRARTITFNGYVYQTTECLIRIHSKHLCESLISLGVVPNKTYQLEYPRITRFAPAFVRGVLDGDGCIYCKGQTPCISAVTFTNSNMAFLQHLSGILSACAGVASHLYTEKEWKHKLVICSDGDIRRFLDWVYQDDGAWRMERKFRKYQTCYGLAAS